MDYSTDYLSGFFDAKACINIYNKRDLRVYIPFSDQDVLNIFKEKFGGTVCKNGDQYLYQIVGNKAKNLIESMLPGMHSNKVQIAKAAIEYQKWRECIGTYAQNAREQALKIIRQEH